MPTPRYPLGDASPQACLPVRILLRFTCVTRLHRLGASVISPVPAAVQELGLDEEEEGDVGSHWLDILHVLPVLRKYSKALRKLFLRYIQTLSCATLSCAARLKRLDHQGPFL